MTCMYLKVMRISFLCCLFKMTALIQMLNINKYCLALISMETTCEMCVCKFSENHLRETL